MGMGGGEKEEGEKWGVWPFKWGRWEVGGLEVGEGGCENGEGEVEKWGVWPFKWRRGSHWDPFGGLIGVILVFPLGPF